MNVDIITIVTSGLVAAAASTVATNSSGFVASVASRLVKHKPVARASSHGKRRRATLTIAPCRTGRVTKDEGQAFAGLLECAGHAIWLQDATVLGVAAYVLNVGTVELSLPTFREQSSTAYAHQTQLPTDVVALYDGLSSNPQKRQDEMSEAMFARHFLNGLRVCTQRDTHVESLLDWYRRELMPKALKAVPTELRINSRV